MTNGERLTKIRKRANAIRKAHPNMKYSSALKEAGKEYRMGHKTKSRPAKKKASPKKRSVGSIKYSGGSVSVGAVEQASKADIKRVLVHKAKEELGWAMVAHSSAKTKTEKKKLAAKVAELKKKLRTAEAL